MRPSFSVLGSPVDGSQGELVNRELSAAPPPEGGGFGGRLKAPKGLAGDAGHTKSHSFGYLESVLILGVDTLVLDVLLDYLFGHVPACTHEVPTCPQVPTPELSSQLTPIRQHAVRSLPLDGLHHSARSQIRRHVQEQVNVVGPHMSSQDLDIQAPAYDSDKLPHSPAYLSSEHRLAELGREYEVVVNVVNGVR